MATRRSTSPRSSGIRPSRWCSACTRDGWLSPRAGSKGSKKPSPIHHPNQAGNWRETMGTEGKESNGLRTGATPQTSGGSEVSAKIESASSQAGRRRFDPGRPLHSLSILYVLAGAEAVDHRGLGGAELDPLGAVELYLFVELFGE